MQDDVLVSAIAEQGHVRQEAWGAESILIGDRLTIPSRVNHSKLKL